MCVKIKVGKKGHYALVDPGWHWLDCVKWNLNTAGNVKYAITFIKHDGKTKRVYMHRIIMGAKRGQKVDHINGDGLYNLRENLRFCTDSQNFQNGRKRKGCTSQYKGIYWDKDAMKWRAQICSDRNRYIGSFDDEVEAAKAYDAKAAEFFGEFAKLNFPLTGNVEKVFDSPERLNNYGQQITSKNLSGKEIVKSINL